VTSIDRARGWLRVVKAVQCQDIADSFVANTSLTGGLLGDALEGAPGYEFED